MAGRVRITGGAAAYRIRDFLTRASVDFEYLDDEGAPGVAVCRLADGSELRDPSLRELASALGLLPDVRPSDTYDVAVVGSGPAGLGTAVYAASEGLRTAVLERDAPGGQAGTSSLIENYLGFPEGISGAELAERARRQAVKFGADFHILSPVTALHPREGAFLLALRDGGTVRARAVLCATGVAWRRLEVPGLARLLSAGVYYGAGTSEAPGVAGKDVLVVGGGNSAGQAAMHLAQQARSVTLLVRGDGLAASMSQYLLARIEAAPNVSVRTHTQVVAVHGDDWIRRADLADGITGQTRTVGTHALFICIGGTPNSDWATSAGAAADRGGYLLTGADLGRLPTGPWSEDRQPQPLETSVPGLFAAGDVRHGSTKRVAAAVGEGAMCIGMVHRVLS